MFLYVFVAYDASRIGGGKFDALGAQVGEDFEAGQADLHSIPFLQFHLLAIVSDRPSLEEGKLRLIIEGDRGVTVVVASFGAQQLVGPAMPGFNLAVFLDGGLLFVEQYDRDRVLGIFRKSLLRGGAQPFRRGVRKHTGGERAEDRRERHCEEHRESSNRDASSYSWQIRHFAERFARRHRFSPC